MLSWNKICRVLYLWCLTASWSVIINFPLTTLLTTTMTITCSSDASSCWRPPPSPRPPSPPPHPPHPRSAHHNPLDRHLQRIGLCYVHPCLFWFGVNKFQFVAILHHSVCFTLISSKGLQLYIWCNLLLHNQFNFRQCNATNRSDTNNKSTEIHGT